MASINGAEILMSNCNWNQITARRNGGGSLNIDKVVCFIRCICNVINQVFFLLVNSQVKIQGCPAGFDAC